MENFVKVEGYDCYFVSNLGNIKTTNKVNEKILKPRVSKFGYQRVMLQNNNIAKAYLIHRLVAIAFIPNPENKPQVNHINGIKSDNRLENLEWCTASENQRHSISIGRNSKGKKVVRIDNDLKEKIYDKIIIASKENNIHKASIQNCLLKKAKTAGGYKWKYYKE